MVSSAVITRSQRAENHPARTALSEREQLIADLRKMSERCCAIANDSYDCVVVVCMDISVEHLERAANWLESGGENGRS